MYCIVYGYARPTAYVHTADIPSLDEAKQIYDGMGLTWGEELRDKHFSIHTMDDIVESRDKTYGFFKLKKGVVTTPTAIVETVPEQKVRSAPVSALP